MIIQRKVRNSHLNQLHLVLSIESFPFHPSTVFQTHSKNAHMKNRTRMSLPKKFPATPNDPVILQSKQQLAGGVPPPLDATPPLAETPTAGHVRKQAALLPRCRSHGLGPATSEDSVGGPKEIWDAVRYTSARPPRQARMVPWRGRRIPGSNGITGYGAKAKWIGLDSAGAFAFRGFPFELPFDSGLDLSRSGW
jgi:hypothetical protein